MSARILFIIFIFLILFLSSGESFAAPPLSLKQSIDTALTKNPSVLSAEKRLEAAKGRWGQAFAGFLPTLSLEGSLGQSYQQPMSIEISGFPPVSITPDEAADVRSYKASLSQPIYMGGKVFNNFIISDLGLKIAQEDLRETTAQVIYDVTVAYFSVLKSLKQLDIFQKAVDSARRHLDSANSAFKVGTATRADVLRAEVMVANAEQGELLAKNNLELAKNSFNKILGRNLKDEVILSETDFKLEELRAVNYEEFLEEAYKNSPAWLSFKYRRDISEKEVALSYSGYLPNISLLGTYGGNYSNYPKEGKTYDLRSWAVMLTGSWTLFDGLRTPSKVKETSSNFSATISEGENLEQAIAIEVKDACLSLNDALDRIESARKALDLAQENAKISELRYTSGVGTNLEVVDAERELTSARGNFLSAEYDYETAKAKINKIIGKEVFKLEARVPEELPITLYGIVRYINLEGGFIGLFEDSGNHYDLMGSKVLEMKKVVGTGEEGRRVKIIGRPKRNIMTIHMWGVPFEVLDYNWQ